MTRSKPPRRDDEPVPEPPPDHHVRIHLDHMLQARDMTLTELAERAGITLVNLSVLKNGRARAIRFTTLTAICEVLECQPGDLLTVEQPPNRPRGQVPRRV